MSRRAWTKDEEGQLREALAQGDACEDVAGRIGRSPASVRSRASRMGLTAHRSPARRWIVAEDARLRALRASGHSVKQIAQRLRRSRAAVAMRLHRLGPPA